MSTEPAAPASSVSPLHQAPRDNAGNATPPLQSQTQRPDTPRQGVIADSAFDQLPRDRQDSYARVRGANGANEWIERSTLPSASDAPTTAPADPSKPDNLAPLTDGKYKFGDTEFTEKELRDYLTAKADAELKKATLPASPADYQAVLPENFQLPAGITDFQFDTTDPLFTAAQAWAHGRGMSQAAFSEALGLYASAKATEAAQLNAAHADQVAKMGVNGPVRVTALETWLRGVVGGQIAGQMKHMLVTADMVKGMETIQHRMTTQGAAPFSQSHREPGQGSRQTVSDEQWQGMSDAQRLDYSRSFDQSQFAGSR